MATAWSGLAFSADSLQFWHRKAGLHSENRITARPAETKVALASQSTEKRKLFDYQYRKEAEYRVFNLSETILANAPKGGADSVNLHFANGMLIPIDLAFLKQNPLFLATKMRPSGSGKWTTAFPTVPRPDKMFRDPDPIKFDGHKLVVTKVWERYPRPKKHVKFSPWEHVSSLQGVEYVMRRAYEEQFRPSKGKPETEGRDVFLDRCQYCHGVLQIGARYGWDFVDPLPIYQKRSVESLFLHVNVKKSEKIQRGIHMPHQPDFSEQEATQMWSWLKAIAERKPSPYKP